MIKIGVDRELSAEEQEARDLEAQIDKMETELEALRDRYDDLGGCDDDEKCVDYRVSEITIYDDGDVAKNYWGEDDEVEDLAEGLILQTFVNLISDSKINVVPDENEMKSLVSQLVKTVEKMVAKA